MLPVNSALPVHAHAQPWASQTINVQTALQISVPGQVGTSPPGRSIVVGTPRRGQAAHLLIYMVRPVSNILHGDYPSSSFQSVLRELTHCVSA